MHRLAVLFLFVFIPFLAESKDPALTTKLVKAKTNEILKAHASYKSLSTELIKRILTNYLEELDPNKSYFIEADIQKWSNPSEETLNQVLNDFNNGNFDAFTKIHEAMITAIERRHLLEQEIQSQPLPVKVKKEEFKNMKWTTSEEELKERLKRIKALQIETSTKLSDHLKDKALQLISKRQAKYEEKIQDSDPLHRQRLILANLLKSVASALDSHTAYFTPEEATQFMIGVQQRLFGIGAQLRDDLNGFTVVKIIEGGPAALGKELKTKDRIIAVNGEPVVGMDIVDAVALIRGEENTPVTLTVIREEEKEEDGDIKNEKKLDIVIPRGEVVLKETRFESSYEPFGDGVIAYLKLFSFYQDSDSSSAQDLAKEIRELKKQHHVKGVILDLRSNSGGMLTQAVEVAGLFITKGVVVSIKDNTGAVQHLRELDEKTEWDGPLVVLINKASASASEIVAQTLQDYGRALIVGDKNSFGKGSFQTFTLNTAKNAQVNPEGEYKVTRGRYYTVSGKTPQLTGVFSDITVPGALSEIEIGEQYSKYPLENDSIKPNFDDDLSDIPSFQRDKIRLLYKFDLQPKLALYNPYLDTLKKNSSFRIEHNKNYQSFLKEVKKRAKDDVEDDEIEEFGQEDLQLIESYNVLKDLIILMQADGKLRLKAA